MHCPQALLSECGPIIEDANWDLLRNVLARVLGVPNNARQNLDNVVAWIDDSREAEKAAKLAAECVEYLEGM